MLASLLFSCSQSNHQLSERKEKEINPLDYTNPQLDSINDYFKDSIFSFFDKKEPQKDTTLHFGWTTVDFFSKKDRFPSFFTFFHRVNGSKEPYLYIACKVNQKYEVVNQVDYDEMMYVQSIYLEDVNFDSINDLVIKSHYHASSRIVFRYDLILTSDFQTTAYLQGTDSLYINPKKKEIITFGDGGVFGPHDKNFYKWQDDSLTLVRYWTASTDIIGTRTTEKFAIKNGEPVRTSYDTMHVEESDMDSIWYAID